MDIIRFLYYNFRYTYFYLRESLAPREKSYSQAGEDRIVEELIGPVNYFIDIGSNDGLSLSNTFYFARCGAAGLCFEPTWREFNKVKAFYRFNRKVRCIRAGISDRSGRARIAVAGGLSYIPETEDQQHTKMHPVLTPTLEKEDIKLLSFRDAIRHLAVPPTVDLLNVDVEGHELRVLTSVMAEPIKYRAIIVETHIRDEWRHRDLDAINSLLVSNGYEAKAQTWVNTIYVGTTR